MKKGIIKEPCKVGCIPEHIKPEYIDKLGIRWFKKIYYIEGFKNTKRSITNN